jgi:hypothetical protein
MTLQNLLYEHCENEEILDKTYIELSKNSDDKLLLLEYKMNLEKYSKSLEELDCKIIELIRILNDTRNKEIFYKKYYDFVNSENNERNNERNSERRKE